MNNLNPTQTGESGKTQQKQYIDKLIVKIIHYSV